MLRRMRRDRRDGQGGSVFVRAQTGAGNTLALGDALYMLADGYGGVGVTGPGGNGIGGLPAWARAAVLGHE